MTDAWNCPHIAGDDGSVGRQPEGRLAGVPHEFTPRQRLSPCAAIRTQMCRCCHGTKSMLNMVDQIGLELAMLCKNNTHC